MQAGMAYLSEDRKNEGLFLDKTITENFLAPNLRPGHARRLAALGHPAPPDDAVHASSSTCARPA